MISTLPSGFDGELMVEDGFSAVQSAIMRKEGAPKFKYHVFDWHGTHNNTGPTGIGDNRSFEKRYAALEAEIRRIRRSVVTLVPHFECASETEIEFWEENLLTQGYEGVCLRDPNGPYKYGRSTTKQGWLLKLKRFEDDEAIVIDVEELMQNYNEAKKNVFGRTQRSSSKEGLVPGDTLGALCVRRSDGIEFKIGTGFSAEQRSIIWNSHLLSNDIVGELVKYKYQPDPTAERPRFPVFLSFRNRNDL